MNLKFYNTTNLVITIIVLYVLLSILLNNFINLNEDLHIDESLKGIYGLIKSISVPSIILAVLGVFDKIAWKWSLTNFLIKVPNLNGRYEGKSLSSYTGANYYIPCVLEIKQTASQLNVTAYFKNPDTNNSSRCEQVCSELKLNEDGFYNLIITYKDMRETIDSYLSDEYGTFILRYLPNENILEGEYFNRRKNIGQISVRLLESELKGKF